MIGFDVLISIPEIAASSDELGFYSCTSYGFCGKQQYLQGVASIVVSQIGEHGYPVGGGFGLVRKVLTSSSQACGECTSDPLRELQIE